MLLMAVVVAGVFAINVDAANKKTRRAVKRTTTTKTAARPGASTGLNIEVFCKYDNSHKECGRAIVLRDTAEIFSNLKAIGYRFEKVQSGKVTTLYPDVRCKEYQTDYYYFVGPTDDDRVYIRDGRVEITFKKESDSRKFINNCLKMGYKYDSADTRGDLYDDQFNCMDFGTTISDYGSIFIWNKDYKK